MSHDILYKNFKDVSREFDEFQVKTHLCKLRCLLLLAVWHLPGMVWADFRSYLVSDKVSKCLPVYESSV